MPTTNSVPSIRLTMSDNTTRPASPPRLPPSVTLTPDPESGSPSLPKTKRNLLSTLKNSPSMLRRKIKPPLLRDSHRTSWEGTDGTAAPSPTSPSHFMGKEFHVKYQGRIRVTTLQVSEAVNAVKKLAPELTASQSVSSSTEDLDVSPSLSPRSSPSTLPRATSPTILNPKSPKSVKSPKSSHKSCSLTISKHSVCIVDDERLVNDTIPIATIAYCATDLRYPRAVAMICKTHKSTLMCHVFICSSREKAEKVVAVIGKAFESAWQDWKLTHEHPTNGAIGVNNNYECFVRGRSRSYGNILESGRGSGLGETTRERHSSYEIRNGDFSSSPEDD